MDDKKLEYLEKTIENTKDKLLVLVFSVNWDPFSSAVEQIFSDLKEKPSLKAQTEVVLLDLDDYFEIALKYDVVIAPSIVLFFNGIQLRIRKIGWEEDKKYVGVSTKENFETLMLKGYELGKTAETVVVE